MLRALKQDFFERPADIVARELAEQESSVLKVSFLKVILVLKANLLC